MKYVSSDVKNNNMLTAELGHIYTAALADEYQAAGLRTRAVNLARCVGCYGSKLNDGRQDVLDGLHHANHGLHHANHGLDTVDHGLDNGSPVTRSGSEGSYVKARRKRILVHLDDAMALDLNVAKNVSKGPTTSSSRSRA